MRRGRSFVFVRASGVTVPFEGAHRSRQLMTQSVYILGGVQTDFSRVWSREGLDISDMIRESCLGAV